MSVVPLLRSISQYILNPLILLAFAIAFVVFFFGIVQFIASDAKRGEGKSKIFWGLLGMFIMVAAYGLIRLVLNTFGIPSPGYPF